MRWVPQCRRSSPLNLLRSYPAGRERRRHVLLRARDPRASRRCGMVRAVAHPLVRERLQLNRGAVHHPHGLLSAVLARRTHHRLRNLRELPATRGRAPEGADRHTAPSSGTLPLVALTRIVVDVEGTCVVDVENRTGAALGRAAERCECCTAVTRLRRLPPVRGGAAPSSLATTDTRRSRRA